MLTLTIAGLAGAPARAAGQDGAGQDGAGPRPAGTARMVDRLAAIAPEGALTNPYAASVRTARLRAMPPPQTVQDRLRYRSEIARFLLNAGASREAAAELDAVLAEASAANGVTPAFARAVRELTALAHLRVATGTQCTPGVATARCSVPIRHHARHPDPDQGRRTLAAYAEILRHTDGEPGALTSRWLLNLVAMMVGDYPFGVPSRWRIPPEAFRSDYDIGRFPDVASPLGVDVAGRKGGVVLDDLDADGDLDLMVSSAGLFTVATGRNPTQLRYLRQEPDGTFTDRTAAAGLEGLASGLNLVQADYDNDGDLDVLVLRGAWLHAPHPNSLLRNDGDGTFADVTEAAGVFAPAPTQTAAWGDYDNDGWVDLFIGNESGPDTTFPCRLFRNNGDGTFTDVAPDAGVALVGFVKGAVWGDYDNDGRQDLYVTRLRPDQPNRLFRNEGPAADGGWRFRDVAAEAGVTGPPVSFPTWFFDYDNDGWLDLFVSGFSGGLEDIVLERLGQPHRGQLPRLYRNRGDGTFADATRAVGLDRLMVGMGANFGDLDNDGFPDLYVGTGDPDYRMLIPNLMFRNAAGAAFQDVTSSGGFGHLQKGHGIAFGDIDADGDQDIYLVAGGAYEGDTFPNALYLNPGHGRAWLTLRLEGVTSNRAAIGARIRVTVTGPAGDRDIHATVGSGGSFGASSLQQEIGLGDATAIRTVQVTWPAGGRTVTYPGLTPNRVYRIREDAPAATPQPSTSRPRPLDPGDAGGAGRDAAARAFDAMAVGDWPVAVAELHRAVADAPADVRLRVQLGHVLVELGDARGAVAAFEEALARDPGRAAAHYALGALLERAGRDDAAIERFATAAAGRDPGLLDVQLRLADALRRAGRFDAALAAYAQSPAGADARFGEAMALVRLGRHRDARDRLEAAMARYPTQPAFPHALARLLAAAPDATVRDGARALDLVQDLAAQYKTAAVAETMAMAFAELGRFTDAAEWQRFAMAVAADAGRTDVSARMSAHLARYQRREPSRTPWRDDDPEQTPGPAVDPALRAALSERP